MIQCKDCKYCKEGANGEMIFLCNPFKYIVEPECLQKWQIMKLNELLSIQTSQARANSKLNDIQDKIIKYVEREIDDMEDADGWKYLDDQEDDPESPDWDEEDYEKYDF
ncbi:hypothetical protein [Sedimentisphaera salicampi]|uniref:Uncharacterized protein n=1 Tax=Sedimentisphaera salicampi TaxID=1941349 RepID=A0A1W6LLU7_9BACT|nr:hypothetical protein [Sedimentisphaera salicampi]ARN56749.1 hypothetical protein STSP1_01140 [Sedimentisphaera salicampi]OXU15190.1 hypothetical protein SMSP1_01122 [Sedimentisphaera salicampi]